jgi:hypothetical protein
MKRVCWDLWVVLAMVTALALSACAEADSVGADPGPEAVHAAWVAAVRQNERDAALALVAPMGGNEIVFVDSVLGRMQEILRDGSNGSVATGTLGGVDTLPLTDAGGGKVGVSVWRFDSVTWCWETQLAPSEGRWAVTNWKQRLDCPEGA